MKTTDREQHALHAYLTLLKQQGVSEDSLSARQEFLSQLIPLLKPHPTQGSHYREAVDDLLQRVDKRKWPFSLNVAREYHRFWINDIKAIAAMHAAGAYAASPPSNALAGEKLQVLWKNLDCEQFTVAEKWPLRAYSDALRVEGATPEVVLTRSKLVKLLLVCLREATEKEGRQYQVAVDSILSLFSKKETRHFFQIVAREFFYFWIGDREAATHIVLKFPVSAHPR